MLSWYILPLDISRSFPLNAFEQLWSACRIAQSHRSVDSSRSAAQWGHFPSVAPSNPLPGQGRVGGSWQPWRRSLLFRDCLNVLKGNQTKVCKSLQIGSKEVLKTIGMQTHGEKNSCSTVQPCINTHGREFLVGSPLPHPCSQSVVAGWLWCLANQAP